MAASSSGEGDGARAAGSIRAAGTRRMTLRRDCTGMTLVDSVVSLGVVAVLASLAVPFLATAREESQVMAAARYLAAQAMLARSRAVRHGAQVGLRFERDGGGYLYASYVDGDGDGIRRADVASGVDRPLDPPRRLRDTYPSVRFELDPALPPLTRASRRGGNADPIRFGAGDTLSFSPVGTATSGTLYLRGRAGLQCALRVLGTTGRIRTLCYHAGDGEWRER